MHLIKYLFCNLSILICIVSCDIIIPNSEDTSIDWSESDYAFIDMENYPEWNTGVFTEDNTYLLVKEDTLSNGYIGYLNNSDIKSDGVALYFDENITLTSFITNSGCCYISWKSSNKADIQVITESSNDIYKNITIDSPQIISTRAAFIPVILAIARGASIAMTINSGVQGIKALLDGDLETAGKNALGLICGGVGGKVFKHALDDVAIDAAFAGFEKLEEKLTQTLQAKYLGNCNVSMNSKKTSINTYSLSITISNYETISATETNYILCGVAVRKWPYVTYSRSELKTEEFVVKGNGTTTINFELPENSGYYAVPYLLPVGGHINLPKDHIRHGNIIHLEYFDGFIDNFKQQSYSENGDKYTFNCNAHAICNTKDGQYWKLYYENNTGWKEFFEAKTYDYPSISSSYSAEFDFEIELSTDLFDDEKEDIKLGIAIFNSSHQVLIASEPQLFELTISRWVDLGLPSGILWAAYNVGASSPEEYGGYYAWGETEEKTSYTFMNYKHGVFHGYDSNGHSIISYVNLGGNISGTPYDTAKANWDKDKDDEDKDDNGDGARMPTLKEMEELASRCKWERTTTNGHAIAKVTGLNGNSIYIPFASGKSNGFNGEGEGVDDGVLLWSSEEMEDNPGYSYFLYFAGGDVDLYGICPREYGISVRAVKDKNDDNMKN